MAATERYTHYVVGHRDLATLKAFVVAELAGSVIAHDRYQNSGRRYYEYDVAISFVGEDRDFARQLATILTGHPLHHFV